MYEYNSLVSCTFWGLCAGPVSQKFWGGVAGRGENTWRSVSGRLRSLPGAMYYFKSSTHHSCKSFGPEIL